MRATGLMIRRYLRKRPGQIIALTLLMVITAGLMNLGYLLGVGFSATMDTLTKSTNAADAMYVVPSGPAGERFVELLEEDQRVTAVEADPLLTGWVSYSQSGEDMATNLLIGDTANHPTMNRPRIVEELATPVADPAWASQILRTSGSYALGDAVTFTAGNTKHTFHIQGFTEEPYTSSPTMGAIQVNVPGPALTRLAEGGALAPSLAVKVQAGSGEQAAAALDAALAAVQGSSVPGAEHFANIWGQELDFLKQGTMIGPNVFAVAFLAFAGIIVVVALIVMRFLIKNLITADMASIGAMRATGFTTGHIVTQLAATFGTAALVATLTGAGLSYLALPGLSASLAAQTGLTWEPEFSWPALLLSVGVLTAAMLTFATIAALRVRSVTTVAALRGGTATHSFRRNHFPLDRGRGSVNTSLGLKSITQRASQNVVMTLTIAAVTFAAVFTVGMSTDMLSNPTALTHMLVGDVEDGVVSLAPEADLDTMVAAARATPGVVAAHPNTVNGLTVSGHPMTVQVADDWGWQRYDATYEGRMPLHDNEVVITGKLARQLGVAVGGSWRAELSGRSAEFLVTGFTSSVRGLGNSATFTSAGYRRLEPSFRQRTISLYVAKDAATDDVLRRLQATHGRDIAVVTNMQQSVNAQLKGYVSMIAVLAAVISAFTAFVVVLVVGLVVTTMIAQSRREMGVHKAVGFTSGDLTAQTLWSYLPVVGFGALVGAAVGALGLNPILGTMLAGIGVEKVDVSMSVLVVAGLALGVVALAGLVTLGATRRIGRISAYALVTE